MSLSILNHLGRNLYRSFMTVLGEAISNSWDADAHNVYVTIDRDTQTLVIRDDGDGMSEKDFQDKFLKIGYSKRKDNVARTNSNRPFIGRKGIGKLALLSCSKTITVLTKTINTDIVGGVIDNSGLDEAIKDDVSSNAYTLGIPDDDVVLNFKEKIGKKGTVIIFEGIKDGIRNRIEYLKKLVALYFRFSLKDSSFNIFINDDSITLKELNLIKEKTQFIWNINDLKDPYTEGSNYKKTKGISIENKKIKGFIASVEAPSNLKINGTEEKISIDLFVNGRLREKDILRHIPTARIVESYLYGQIHYDDLDDETDRFTSSREGVVPDDPKFKGLLSDLEKALKTIINDWDVWRSDLNQDGDAENLRITKKKRKSKELINIVIKDFQPSKENEISRKKVDGWINKIREDAEFNLSSYVECFISENLLREYITDKKISIPLKVKEQIDEWKTRAERAKECANISFNIREDVSDLSYLDMGNLATIADDEIDKIKRATLRRDAIEYKPIRDASAHTARLTKQAKDRLSTIYENIKARIVCLLNKA